MNICVIDWAAVAAWVQAIGSIGAIVAAIEIGRRQHRQSIALVEKQHRQNIDLVEHEQKRVREASEKEATEEGRSLKELVMIVLNPLMTNAETRLEALAQHRGRIEPLPSEIMQHIDDTEAEAEATKKQLAELREVFLSRPRYLLVHGHLIRSLSIIAKICHEEKLCDALRNHLKLQISQALYNGPHMQLIPEQPYDVEDLVEAMGNLHKVFLTVGE